MNRSRSLYAAAVLLTALLAPIPASAAAAKPAMGTVDYQMWMGSTPGQSTVLVSLQLPDSARLPSIVRIPVPPGMTVKWAGEISGGSASSDLERSYVVRRGVGGEYVEFEVEKYRRAQVDVAGKGVETGTAAVSEQFDFVQTVPSGESGFAVRVPPAAYDVGIDPAAVQEPQIGVSGEALYRLPARQLKLGETARVSVTFRVRRVPLDDAQDAGAPRRILIGIALAAGFVIVALVVAVRGVTTRRG